MDQSTRLIYTFSHNTVVLVRKEIQLYTLASFFADFGGYLGLLLGESLVSYLLRVAHWIKKLKQKYQHKKIAYKNEQTTTGSVLSKYKNVSQNAKTMEFGRFILNLLYLFKVISFCLLWNY